MRFTRFKGSWAPARFSAALLTVLIAGCGGSDKQGAPDPIGSGDETGSSGSPSTLQFSAHSGTEKITLLWSGVEDIDILYSADSSCDWANYALCAGAGMVPNATGGRHVLTLARDSHHMLTLAQDGLQPNINYFFVGEAAGTRTPTVSAKALVPSSDNRLAQLATSLEPGEFVPLDSKASEGEPTLGQLLRGYRPDGSGAPSIDTWTDSAHWDPLRQRTFFQGLRQSNRFISYDATRDAWEEFSLDQPNAPPLFERFGHIYGRTALDWERGHFYRLAGSTLHRYVIDEERWEKFENSPIGGYISIDWHYGLDMLVGLANHDLHGFREGQWFPRGRADVHGYHSSAQYNSVRNDMLFIGGNHSRRNVNVLNAEGGLLRMADAPFDFGISQDSLTYDPLSGNYIVLHRDRRLWEYNPDRDEWRVARDFNEPDSGWPFGRYWAVVPIPIDELGVIMWQFSGNPRIYLHETVFGPSH